MFRFSGGYSSGAEAGARKRETIRNLIEHRTTGEARKEAVHTFNYFGELQ